jgi:hypothetical protein
VDFKSYVAASRAGLDNNVPFRASVLENSRKPKRDDRKGGRADPLFSAAEMRHNFAIWALAKSALSRHQLHLYYCVRCKWAFRIDDNSGLVTPLDENSNPIPGSEAAERLATFGVGPCPVFNRFTTSAQITQVVGLREVFRGRLAALFHAMGRIWNGLDRRCRRPASLGKDPQLKWSIFQ